MGLKKERGKEGEKCERDLFRTEEKKYPAHIKKGGKKKNP